MDICFSTFFNASKPFKAALTHSALSSSASKASWQSGVTTSDHKPVWGMFEVRVKPGKDSVPLAGGLFNRWCLVFLIFNKIFSRAVYLEGLKRRSESLKPHLGRGHTAANICNVSWWWSSMMGQIYAALIWQLNKSWSFKIKHFCTASVEPLSNMNSRTKIVRLLFATPIMLAREQ